MYETKIGTKNDNWAFCVCICIKREKKKRKFDGLWRMHYIPWRIPEYMAHALINIQTSIYYRAVWPSTRTRKKRHSFNSDKRAIELCILNQYLIELVLFLPLFSSWSVSQLFYLLWSHELRNLVLSGDAFIFCGQWLCSFISFVNKGLLQCWNSVCVQFANIEMVASVSDTF